MQDFNPLFTIRYSATHKEEYNKVNFLLFSGEIVKGDYAVFFIFNNSSSNCFGDL